jgi:hypothetical protein
MPGMRPGDPADLLGAYRTLDDVPDRHRLRHHADAYRGRDAWAEWAEAEVLPGCGEAGGRLVRRHGEDWRGHMGGRRHHALARPGDVEDYARGLLDGPRSGRTAAEYWRRVAGFYDFLLGSTAHPHLYSPVLMAAAAGGAAGEMWRVAGEER